MLGRTRTIARRGSSAAICLLLTAGIAVGQSPEDGTPEAPSGGAPAGPRSRLTLRGEFTTATFAQKNFALGASRDSARISDFDAFWTQELRLYPRLILSDDLNVNLRVIVASGIWGVDDSPAGAGGVGDGSYFDVRLSWAYLAYQHRSSRTRWYLGRQRVGLGHSLVLDENAPGLQIYRDFGRANWLRIGYAKELEGAGGISDANSIPRSASGVDGRDADLYLVEWKTERSNLTVNPFFVSYVDRGNADGSTLLPDGLGYAEARFRPNVSQATVLGIVVGWRGGPIRVDFEYDKLSGKDRVANLDSGPDARLDMNNGDLTGSNLYARVVVGSSRFEIGGTVGMGSGDEDPRSGEGNFNALRTDGYFHVTEIWEDTISSDEEGIGPGGLGAPHLRGYRGLENTKIYQGHVAFRLRQNLRISGAGAMIRASQPLRRWSDVNDDGRISPDEFGGQFDDQLGSEIDARIDWRVGEQIDISLRGGLFFPRVASSLLLYGTDLYQEQAREVRLSVRVPISEFSLGG